ncbi:hypothetical protein QT971_19115 [Microcoleus sp. herbarium19]|uniref:hypothetical protein n=1 Tax=unclassified Microcoleus TaxID=2642155 RepID=UPI002FD635DD
MNKIVWRLRVISTLIVSCLISNVDPCLAKELSKVEQHGVIAKVPRIPIQSTKLTSFLSNFRMRQIRLGPRTFTLGRSNFRHILEQHHPRFMNPRPGKDIQTFFDKNMKLEELLDLMELFVRQNSDAFSDKALKDSDGEVVRVVNGVKYKMGIDTGGRIRTFFPYAK